MIFNLGADFASTTLDGMGSVIQPFVPLITVVSEVALAIIAMVFLIRALTHH